MFMGLVVAILISDWMLSDSPQAAHILEIVAWLVPGLAVVELVRQLMLHYYASGIVRDIPDVEAFRQQEPQFPLETIRWLVARKRLWKGLARPGCWLVSAVAGAMGFFALDRFAPGIAAGGMLLLILAPFCAVTLLMRAASFVFASRLMGIGDRAKDDGEGPR
jgi:hypothetical protein